LRHERVAEIGDLFVSPGNRRNTKRPWVE